jgi:D-alanyl-D-alanine carboxypeptidase
MEDTPLASPPPDLTPHLEEHLDRLAAQRGVHHVVAAVAARDGTFSWSGARGLAYASGEAMQTATPFHIASIDKMMTATVILRLHEEGRISIHQPIVQYLPGALVEGLHRLHGYDHTGDITVLHLLSHTSGLPDYLEDVPRGGKSLIEEIFEGEDRAITVGQMVDHVRESLRPHFPPAPAGERRRRARYSDTNFQLLGAIAQQATGEPLHQLFDRLIFRPAGMTSTSMPGFLEPASPTPAPATLWVGDEPLDRPLAIQSLQSVYSTTEDLLRFFRALLDGRLFTAPATWGMMRGTWTRLGFPTDRAALRQPGWPIEYSLGLMRFQLPRPLSPLYAMPAVIGHSGSTGSWLFYCEKLDVLLAGTVDQAHGGAVPYRLIPRLLRTIERVRSA